MSMEKNSKAETLKVIGKKMREDARDIVESHLPARFSELLRQLDVAERPSPTSR